MLNLGILIWKWKLSIPSSPERCVSSMSWQAIALFQAKLSGTGDTKWIRHDTSPWWIPSRTEETITYVYNYIVCSNWTNHILQTIGSKPYHTQSKDNWGNLKGWGKFLCGDQTMSVEFWMMRKDGGTGVVIFEHISWAW